MDKLTSFIDMFMGYRKQIQGLLQEYNVIDKHIFNFSANTGTLIIDVKSLYRQPLFKYNTYNDHISFFLRLYDNDNNDVKIINDIDNIATSVNIKRHELLSSNDPALLLPFINKYITYLIGNKYLNSCFEEDDVKMVYFDEFYDAIIKYRDQLETLNLLNYLFEEQNIFSYTIYNQKIVITINCLYKFPTFTYNFNSHVIDVNVNLDVDNCSDATIIADMNSLLEKQGINNLYDICDQKLMLVVIDTYLEYIINYQLKQYNEE